MYGLYKEKEILESKLLSVSLQDDGEYHSGNRHICKLDEVEIGKKATDVTNLEMLYKYMNELKVKAKVYDTFFMGSTCLIIVLMVLVGAVIVVSLNK